MTYNVWMEGYAATGEYACATYLGNYTGKNFKEACIKALKRNKYDMSYYNEHANIYWGCRLFPNEADARRSFG